MKKSVLLIALVFGMTGAFAQDLTTKKGEPILPEAGDWAIMFNANPFLEYAGGFLSGTGATAPIALWTDGNGGSSSLSRRTIMGKMFKDEKTAYRAMVRIGFGSSKQTEMVADASVVTPPTFPNVAPMKEDVMKVSDRFIGLGAGMEMRRGKTRLQGYYGADAMIWLSGGKSKYEYGNAVSTTTGIPPTHDFGTNMSYSFATGEAARATEEKLGSTFGLGIRGFIGAEYFIFSKISIGAEYGWGVDISSTGASEYTIEGTDGATLGTQTVETGKSSGWSIDTDINKWWGNQGELFLALHF